jgi:tetratricopeptide (TPR) repeat protein
MVFLAAAAGGIAIVTSRAARALRPVAWGVVAIVLIGLGVHARSHSALYVDNETLFRSVIARNPGSWMAHHILALELSRMPGRSDEALVHMREAIRFNPEFPDAHFALGVELM